MTLGTSPWGDFVTGPRPGSMRDRRGRGRRGVLALPGPLSPRGVPSREVPSETFDRLVGTVLRALAPAFRAESDRVEVVVEDVPRLPPEWEDPVPSSVVTTANGVTRVVLFRVPISQRARDAKHLEDLTWTALLEQLAAVWRVSPDDLDPR